jgi:hypothetical protein
MLVGAGTHQIHALCSQVLRGITYLLCTSCGPSPGPPLGIHLAQALAWSQGDVRLKCSGIT